MKWSINIRNASRTDAHAQVDIQVSGQSDQTHAPVRAMLHAAIDAERGAYVTLHGGGSNDLGDAASSNLRVYSSDRADFEHQFDEAATQEAAAAAAAAKREHHR